MIKSILNLTLKIGNNIRKSWFFILSLISKLHSLRLIKNQIDNKKTSNNLDEQIEINM